jgi:FkbM family methyltransferase
MYYVNNIIKPYESDLEKLWNIIGEYDKELLISLIAFRILGYSKVKLNRNNDEYWEAIKTGESLSNSNDTYDPKFMHFILEKVDLNPIGYDVKLYFSGGGVAIDFILEQYALKRKEKYVIHAEKDDVVLDIGGCWGDTALYFAHKVGENGKVYSFEFIPKNIELHKLNQSFNESLQKNIQIVENPVFNNSKIDVFFKDNGPGSKIEFHPFDEMTGKTQTITIDDFVKNNNIQKIDFIKMDIEGAEPFALEGGIETIKRFKPKLAIAIYHSWEDLVNIPLWIVNLNLGYEIYIDHFTIHTEETVVYAKIKE